jgi:FkbM family methyltransferase
MTNLYDLIPGLPSLVVVDVGAMMLEGRVSCCEALINLRKAAMIGFEPNTAECERLNRSLGAPHRFYPYFIGDGQEATYHQTNLAMTGSLYEPNRALLDRYNNLGELVRLFARHPVRTVRLDDVPDLNDVDLIKADVQGAELAVLKGGIRLLRRAVVVQVEVEFVELYRSQPLFSDVDRFLREQDFQFHTFLGLSGRCLKPMVVDGDINRPLRQVLWADAVYVRDIWKPLDLESDKLLKLATLLHHEYGSFDMAHAALARFDELSATAHAPAYLAAIVKGTAPS